MSKQRVETFFAGYLAGQIGGAVALMAAPDSFLFGGNPMKYAAVAIAGILVGCALVATIYKVKPWVRG